MVDIQGGGEGAIAPPLPLAMDLHNIKLSSEAQLNKFEGQILYYVELMPLQFEE